MTSTEEQIVCPHSLAQWDHAMGDYAIHHASRAELDANGGICAKCRVGILKRGARQAGRERPCEITPMLHHDGDAGSGAGWADGHIDKSEDFDWATIDEKVFGMTM